MAVTWNTQVATVTWTAVDDPSVTWVVQVDATVTGGGGVTDHGDLTGLADDDHTQYLTNARGDARYDAIGSAAAAAAGPTQVYLGPEQLVSAFGAATAVWTADSTGERIAGWRITDATAIYLGGDLAAHIPADWEAVDVYAQIYNVNAGSGNIACRWESIPLGVGDTMPTTTLTPTWEQGARLEQIVAAGSQWVLTENCVARALAVPPAKRYPYKLSYIRNDADDTLSGGIVLAGLRLVKVSGTDDSTATTALASFRAALIADAADLSYLVLSDSTADWDVSNRDWPRRLSRRIHYRHPAYSSRDRIWNPSSWGSYTTQHTGTGSHMLTLHNAAVGGWTCPDATTALSALASGISPDVILVSLGANDSTVEATFTAYYQALIDALQTQFPGKAIVCISQQKDQVSPANQTMRRTVIQTIATAEGCGFVDISTEFASYTTATGHYSDSIHQTGLGSEFIAGRVFGAIR